MRRAKPVDGGSDGRMDAAEAKLEKERRFVAERQISPRCDLEARENMALLMCCSTYISTSCGWAPLFGQTYVIG